MDQTTDLNGQQLHRILSVYPLPDFVKNASQEEVCGKDDLPPHLFADMTRRRYPIHSGPATVVSSIFFNEKKAEMNPHLAQIIEEKLEKAAEYFRVTGYTRRMREKVASDTTPDQTALTDDVFAIVFEGTDGTTERHYPMRNINEVKTAAAWLVDHRADLPFEDRRQIADKVLEKAAKFGAGLPEHRHSLEKMAGLGACAGKDAAKLIRTRIYSLGHSHKPNTMQQELEKLAQLCEKDPKRIQHFADLTKIASVIDAFDRQHGLHNKYDDVIERPEDVLFAVTEKAAAEVDDSIVGNALTGNYYKKADLQRLPVRDLADNLGDDFATEVSTADAWVDTEKLASIVPTLPLGDAELFDEVVVAAGITPFATKAASAGRSISPVEQVEMAKQHKPAPGSLWDRIRS
jgi:hypothetical protein